VLVVVGLGVVMLAMVVVSLAVVVVIVVIPNNTAHCTSRSLL
jgi:uncharacterized membrane protein YqjE